MSNTKLVSSNKFGARVYLMDAETALVLQTVKKGTRQNAPYVVDQRPKNEGEKFVSMTDDASLGKAIRAALGGEL
ncbi:MAG: hypothetical protein IH956_07145 [Chloroflexi bacterium]|nr:hypothetical protein [Chloroflexota bacterium]